jgi:hypothetical protein
MGGGRQLRLVRGEIMELQIDDVIRAARIRGAPAEISSYEWLELRSTTATDQAIPFEVSLSSTYGTLQIGWDMATRRAVYLWAPAARPS